MFRKTTPEVLHRFCSVCDPQGTIADCGADITEIMEVDEEDGSLLCRPCAFLQQLPCPGCGL